MFPVGPEFVAIALFIACTIGALFGALCGLICSLLLRLDLRGIWKDALLGVVAVPAALFLVFVIPWPENTINTEIGGGGQMQETMSRFQHPFLAAFVLAALLPALRQLYRYGQLKSKPA